MKHPLAQFVHCPKCGSAHFVINNDKSKLCKDCDFVYYFNPSAATVAVIINAKGELLVCERARNPAKGTYDLPGGFVDVGETGEEAIQREVFEEVGLEVVEASYLFSIPNTYLYSGFLVHTLDLFYLCSIKSCKNVLAQDDVSDAKFIALENIDPQCFGLSSIQMGVKRLLEEKMI